jgi:hypothetical protein
VSYPPQPMWGPRPGGPAVPPPSPPQPSGCLVVIMLGVGMLGLLFLAVAKYNPGIGVLGLLILAGVVWFFVNLLNGPGKARRAAEAAQRQYQADSKPGPLVAHSSPSAEPPTP